MIDLRAEDLNVRRIPGSDIVSVLAQYPVLHARMAYPSFFCKTSWLSVVLRHTDPEHCFGLLASSDDGPIALLPLQSVRNWMGGRDLRFLGYGYYPDPLGVICDSRHLPRAISAFLDHLRQMKGWDRLILDYMLPEEGALWSGKTTRQCVSPYLPLSCSFDELLSRYPGKKRYKIRSKVAKMREEGFALHSADTPEERTRLLYALFELHRLRSEAISRDSSIRSPAVERLHFDLVTSATEARLLALKDNERTVAVLYGFEANGVFHFFQIAHDPRFDSLRPGTVLLTLSIEAACESGTTEFNFLQGDEAYKYEWTATGRCLAQIKLVSRRLRPRLANQFGDFFQRLKRIAYTDPIP